MSEDALARVRRDASGIPPHAANTPLTIAQMPPDKALGPCLQRCMLPRHPSRVRCLQMVAQPTSGQQERLTGPGQSTLALEPQSGPACRTRQGREQQVKGLRGGPVTSLVRPLGAAPHVTPSHLAGRIELPHTSVLPIMMMLTGGRRMGHHATMHLMPPSPLSAQNLRQSGRDLWTADQLTPLLQRRSAGPSSSSSSHCGSQQRMR